MILVVAGTVDGRNLAHYLKEQGLSVIISVTSAYGGLLAEGSADEVNVDFLTQEAFIEFLQDNKIKVVVDASHPYAVNVSKNVIKATIDLGIFYVRYEREQTLLDGYPKLYKVKDTQEAAQKAVQLGENIFLTVGSRTLSIFKEHQALQNKRLIARVLPDINSLNICFDLGFLPRDVIAMQGPFSVEMNKVMFQDFQADVIVTKDSGKTGGADTKLLAAEELGLPIVLIERPTVDYTVVKNSFADIYEYISEVI